MRWLALLALPLLTAAAPGITSGPDQRELREQPGVIQGGGWDLACLFSSATSNVCSDSRTVTTTRSTAVPCLQSDGSWGTAAINTACIAPGGVAGVESYGAVTNYVTNSTNVALYTKSNASITVSVSGDGYTVVNGGTDPGGVYSVDQFGLTGETWTTTCEVKGSGSATLYSGGGEAGCVVALTSGWVRRSCSRTLSMDQSVRAFLFTVGGASVDVRQCQLEKSADPGRRCDSGGTATTCGADQHEVSTKGWPTDTFSIRIGYMPAVVSAASKMLVDSRVGFDLSGLYVYATGQSVVAGVGDGSDTVGLSADAGLTAGVETQLVMDCGGGRLRLSAGGVEIANVAASHCAATHKEKALLGSSIFGEPAQGLVRLIDIGPMHGSASVYAIGDSITQGVGVDAYPIKLQTALGDSYWVANRGHNGWTTAQMVTLWTDEMRAERPSVVVLLGGINSINNGATAAAVYSEISTIYAQAESDGARVIAVTLLPFSSSASWSAPEQAEVESLNAMIRATGGVAVVDAYAEMGEPGTPSRLRVAYDSGDGLHPNAAGAAALAALVADAIQ